MAINLAGFQQILTITAKTHVRCLSSSTVLLGRRSVVGAMKAMKLQEEQEVEGMTADEMDAIIDSDMTTLKDNVAQLDHDAAWYQNNIRFKTVKQKYFREYREKEENLLTWAMKEQLCYLHSTDPYAWTPEVLAKAFPISPAGVPKLLKSKWVPQNEEATERHDHAVATRWKRHMKGQLGSARLINMALLRKFSKKTAPVPTLCTDELLTSLQNMKFDNEEKIHSPKGLRHKNRLPDTSKYKCNFSKIITDYEDQLPKRGNERENPEDKNPASAIPPPPSTLTTGPPQYLGTYSKISAPSNKQGQDKNHKKSMNMKKLMTFSDFLKQKSQT